MGRGRLNGHPKCPDERTKPEQLLQAFQPYLMAGGAVSLPFPKFEKNSGNNLLLASLPQQNTAT